MKQDRFSTPLSSPSLRAAEHTRDNRHNLKKQATRLRPFLLIVLATALAAIAFGKGQPLNNLSVTTNFASADASDSIRRMQCDHKPMIRHYRFIDTHVLCSEPNSLVSASDGL